MGDSAAVQTGAVSAGWVDASHSGTSTSLTLSGLTNGTSYRVRVRATNKAGDGPWAHVTSAAGVPPDVPELRIAVQEGSLGLRWQGYWSSDWGSWERGGFLIHFKGGGVSEWTVIGFGRFGLLDPSTTGASFGGRVPLLGGHFHTVVAGASYDIRLTACGRRAGATGRFGANRSDYACGSPVEASATTATAAAPAGLSVTPGSLSLDLAWTAPPRTVSAITGYEVHYTSASGEGAGAVAGDAAVQTGGSASPADGWVAVSRSGTATAQTVKGLETGTRYRLRVRAVNAQGHGIWAHGTGTPQLASGTSWSTTFTPPDLRAGLLGCGTRAACDAALSDNSFTVGGTEFGFRYMRFHTVTGLLDVRVTPNSNAALRALEFCSGAVAVPMDVAHQSAHAEVVYENASAGWQAGVPIELRIGSNCAVEAPLSAPVNLRTVARDGTLHLLWSIPVEGDASGYEWQWKAQAAPDAAATTADDPATGWVSRSFTDHTSIDITISGLVNGTTYDVRLRATGAGDPGPWATATGTPQGAPGAPVNLGAVAGDARLDLSWAAPSSDGGSALTGYDVHYTSAPAAGAGAVADDAAVQTGGSPSAADGWVAADRGTESDPPAVSQAITGLTNDQTYRVRVRAKNAHGASAWLAGRGRPAIPPARKIWSATLKVQNLDADHEGCSNATTGKECSSASVLTDDDFRLLGTTWEITRIADATGPNNLQVDFNRNVGTALDTYKLCVGTTAFAFLSGTHPVQNGFRWDYVDEGWTTGDTVLLSIATTCPDTVPATNAKLSGLAASTSTGPDGTFSTLDIGTFSAATAAYAATVPYAQSHVKLTPTVGDAGKATVGVRNGSSGRFTPVASGSASTAIALREGANPLTVRVTAGDRRTTRDYTVTVTRGEQPPATLTLSAPSILVEEGQPATVTATLSRALPRALAIPVTVTRGSAEAEDLGTLTAIRIARGQTSGTARIATRQDDDMDDETFTVALDTANLPSDVTAGATTSVALTIDDDDTPTVNLSFSPRDGIEAGESVTLTATLSAPLGSAVTIPLVAVPEEGTTSADYGAVPRIRIEAGETGGSGTLATTADNDTEYESFKVMLDTANLPAQVGAGPRWSVRVWIKPREVPVVWLSAPATANEGESVTVTARLSKAVSSAVQIPVTATFGSGPAASHDIPVAANATSGTLAIATRQDDDSRDDTLTVEIDRKRLLMVEPYIQPADLLDDDRPQKVAINVIDRPALTVQGGSAREGSDEAVTFTVRLSYAAAQEVTVAYATADAQAAWQGASPATAGQDYTARSGSLTFAVGERQKTVPVPILDDAIDEGREHFLLRLTSPQGAYVKTGHGEAHGIITNDDPLQTMWLSRFGRTVAESHVAAIRDRLAAGREPGLSARFAGQPLPLPQPQDDGAAQTADADGMKTSPDRRVARDASNAGTVLSSRTASGDADALAETDGEDTLAFRSLRAFLAGDEDEGEESVQAVAADDVLLGTDFVMTRDAGSGLSHGFWGRATRSGFGGREGRTSVDGAVTSVLLGTDWKRKGMAFGVIVSESRGSMTYDGASKGAIEARLSALVPWAGRGIGERSSLWGAIGIGRGDMTLRPDEGAVAVTGIGWRMAALGAEGALAPGARLGGASLGWHADALATRTRSDAVPGLAAGSGRTTRMRAGITAAWERTLANGATLSPRLEAGVRHDGGDAETGIGLEVGGGIAFADPARGLSMTVDARTLALHEDGDFRDWGLSLGFSWDPRPETKRGCSATAQLSTVF